MNKVTHFKIGKIVNTQGLKGEVRVYCYTFDFHDYHITFVSYPFNFPLSL